MHVHPVDRHVVTHRHRLEVVEHAHDGRAVAGYGRLGLARVLVVLIGRALVRVQALGCGRRRLGRARERAGFDKPIVLFAAVFVARPLQVVAHLVGRLGGGPHGPGGDVMVGNRRGQGVGCPVAVGIPAREGIALLGGRGGRHKRVARVARLRRHVGPARFEVDPVAGNVLIVAKFDHGFAVGRDGRRPVGFPGNAMVASDVFGRGGHPRAGGRRTRFGAGHAVAVAHLQLDGHRVGGEVGVVDHRVDGAVVGAFRRAGKPGLRRIGEVVAADCRASRAPRGARAQFGLIVRGDLRAVFIDVAHGYQVEAVVFVAAVGA